MSKRVNLSLYLTYSSLCAMVYSVPLVFLLINKLFENLWLLFLGNSLFFLVVLFSIIHINNKLYQNGNLGTLVLSGIYVTLASIVMIAVIAIVLYISFDLSSLRTTGDPEALHDVSNISTDQGNASNLLFMILVSGLFVNFLVGAFASFVASATAKRRQSTEKGKKANITNDLS